MAQNEQTIRSFINQHKRPQSQLITKTMDSGNIHIHRNDAQSFYNQNNGGSCGSGGGNDNELDDFKNKVKIWMRLDNEIKEFTKEIKMLNVEIKQRKRYLSSLTPLILSYMNCNEIEELNSKDGRLQCRTSLIKPPLSQKDLKFKLYDRFPNNQNDLDKIFNERDRVEKVSLRRLM